MKCLEWGWGSENVYPLLAYSSAWWMFGSKPQASDLALCWPLTLPTFPKPFKPPLSHLKTGIK